MKIYTKTGDDGTTSLLNGKRVPKYSTRVELYGSVDELNAVIGTAASEDIPSRLKKTLTKLNATLFFLGSDLAAPFDPPPKFEINRIGDDEIQWLESKIDEYSDELPELKNFILPGGSKCAAHLHHARTVCRRAERLAVRLATEEDIGEYAIKFLNRLSDYLFVAARMANNFARVEDVKWSP